MQVYENPSIGHVVEGFHFTRETYRGWGTPFSFVIKNEPLVETKNRLSAKLTIPIKEFEKIKIALVSKINSRVEYLDDDFDFSKVDFKQPLALGLDHIDKSQRSRSGGGGIKIN